jgi:hypothetical protein
MATRSNEELREIVRRLILKYSAHKISYGEIEIQPLMDEERGHYQVVHVGWDRAGDGRVHGCVLHIDVIGDKVWIQNDGTSPGVAEDLLEAGIPHDSIVLGFHPEFVRQHTGFAIR